MAWKTIGEVTKSVDKYIDDRRKGLIKSVKTGFNKLDSALLDGIEYGSIISIGGRPSIGKTAYSSCILRGILKNNDLSDLAILDFNWEMSSSVLLLRDLSADSGNSYKDVISANGIKVTDEAYKFYSDRLKEYEKLPIYYEEEPKTALEFSDSVRRKRDLLKDKKIIVRIDHATIGRKSASESSQVEMLQNLLFEANKLKKQSSIIFLFLTQLNRECENRQESGTDNAFMRQSDCYGGDAVAQFSEALLLLNRPSKYGITYYGSRPNGILNEKNDLFTHIVKNRNGEADIILRHKTHFETMSMIET